MDILERTRAAIRRVFSDYLEGNFANPDEALCEHTNTGLDDPGQWAPRAAVVVVTESLFPHPLEMSDYHERWFRVSAILRNHFCEPVNDAIVAIYRV